MARNKTSSKKTHLAVHSTRTKWAPFWTIFKAFGKGKKIHPSRLTRIKRSWRSTKLQRKIRRNNRIQNG